MDELLQQLTTDPWGRLALQYLATGGMGNVFTFLLVSARLAGVFVVAPLFITSGIPLAARIALVVMLSLIIAPTLSAAVADHSHITVAAYETASSHILSTTLSDFACVLGSEVGLGAIFGIGLLAIFSGLKLGAEWLDRHTGLGMGTVFNPDWSAGQSACGSLVQLFGIAAVLLLEPIGGQWLLLQSLIQSFQAIPVGSAIWSTSAVELMSGIVQQSLILGLRIAMPLVATMTLVDVALAFASRGGPQPLSSAYLAIRLGVGLIVLALTMTTIPEVMSTTLISILRLASGNL